MAPQTDSLVINWPAMGWREMETKFTCGRYCKLMRWWLLTSPAPHQQPYATKNSISATQGRRCGLSLNCGTNISLHISIQDPRNYIVSSKRLSTSSRFLQHLHLCPSAHTKHSLKKICSFNNVSPRTTGCPSPPCCFTPGAGRRPVSS